MPNAAILALIFVVSCSWLYGGGFDGIHWFMLGGGTLCLIVALIERMRSQTATLRASWRLLPWIAFLALIGVSTQNPSHAPDLEMERVTHNAGVRHDTLGSVNPVKPIEHNEALPTTTDPTRTFLYGLSFLGLFAFAIALAVTKWRPRDIRWFLAVLFFNSILLALVGLWYFSIEPDRLFGTIKTEGNSPFASFHYKNCWAGFATLGISCGIGLALHAWRYSGPLLSRKNPATLYLLLTPLLPLTFPLCESRAGIVMICILIGWFGLSSTIRLVSSRQHGIPWTRVAMAILLIGGTAWFAWASVEPELKKLSRKSEAQLSGDQMEGRIVLIKDTIRMASEKPLLGWGLATFSQVYPVFQSPELYRRITFVDGDFKWVPAYYEFTHSDWVQYWAEVGWVGLVLLVATPLLWVIHGWRKGKRNYISHWLGVGAIAILILAGFEFPFGCEALTLFFTCAVVLGTKYALLEKKYEERRYYRQSKRRLASEKKLESSRGENEKSPVPDRDTGDSEKRN